MKKLISIFAILLTVASISACTNRQVGTAGGAVIGGVAGGALTGSAGGAVVGAAGGALIGNAVSR